MMQTHIQYLKSRYHAPIYVSAKGDVLVDVGGRAMVANSREVRLNTTSREVSMLWAIRSSRLATKTSEHLASQSAGWRLV